MSSETVRLIATMIARPGKAGELEALLVGLIEPTHAEAGCRQYDLWRNNDNPDEFRFIEEWDSVAALDAHLETPHLQHALVRLPDLLTQELDLQKYALIRPTKKA